MYNFLTTGNENALNYAEWHVQLASSEVMADLHVASRDYCHAPMGVSSFSFSIQK